VFQRLEKLRKGKARGRYLIFLSVDSSVQALTMEIRSPLSMVVSAENRAEAEKKIRALYSYPVNIRWDSDTAQLLSLTGILGGGGNNQPK